MNKIQLDDRDDLKKPRHTAVRIFERLRDGHSYPSGYTVVREFVAKERLRQQEVLSLWRIRPAALNSSCHSLHLTRVLMTCLRSPLSRSPGLSSGL